jgi:hypothetical protein
VPIEVGQVWVNVKVSSDPRVNRLGLKPGTTLPPIRVAVKVDDLWSCAFVGEQGSQVYADEAMLRTGAMRGWCW